MTPEVRAAADRFIYEQATVKLIAALAPEGALGRTVPAYSWTARQLLGHLAETLNTYAGMFERWLLGEPPLAGPWEPDEMNAETATRLAVAPLPEIMRLFGIGLNRLVAALSAIPDERATDQFGPAPLPEVLKVFSGHCLGHAIPLLDAIPEARMDPLVLNWLLHADFAGQSDKKWQSDLLAEAREYIANHPEEEEDEA